MVVSLVCTSIESPLAMDMLQPKNTSIHWLFTYCQELEFLFFLSLMMMKLDMIFTKHGCIWDKIVIKLDGLGISNVYKCFLVLFTLIIFASDEVCVEIE